MDTNDLTFFGLTTRYIEKKRNMKGYRKKRKK